MQVLTALFISLCSQLVTNKDELKMMNPTFVLQKYKICNSLCRYLYYNDQTKYFSLFH